MAFAALMIALNLSYLIAPLLNPTTHLLPKDRVHEVRAQRITSTLSIAELGLTATLTAPYDPAIITETTGHTTLIVTSSSTAKVTSLASKTMFPPPDSEPGPQVCENVFELIAHLLNIFVTHLAFAIYALATYLFRILCQALYLPLYVGSSIMLWYVMNNLLLLNAHTNCCFPVTNATSPASENIASQFSPPFYL